MQPHEQALIDQIRALLDQLDPVALARRREENLRQQMAAVAEMFRDERRTPLVPATADMSFEQWQTLEREARKRADKYGGGVRERWELMRSVCTQLAPGRWISRGSDEEHKTIHLAYAAFLERLDSRLGG